MFCEFDSLLIVDVEVEVGYGSGRYFEVELGGIFEVEFAWYLEVELAQNRRVLMCSTVGIRLRVFRNRGSRY